MIRELKYVFYIVTIFFFIFFVIRYYFSDEYIKKSYRSLNLIDEKINTFSSTLKILEGDTSDIIKYVENLGIANKESIICGWKFISKELKKYTRCSLICKFY